MKESVLAIIGGGRWGQVMLSVAANMSVPFDRIVIVSQANAVEVRRKIADLNLVSHIPFEILPAIEDLFAKYKVEAAIIANSARHHFATARQLINQGVNVLIEKPIVPSIDQIQILIKEAEHHNVSLVPGLSYRFCSYIKNFSHEVSKRGVPQQFHLKWCDAQDEIRYGQVKRHDISISVIQDVMPHIWTILSIVFPHQKINIHTGLQDNDSAVLSLSISHIKGQVLLERNGIKRERYLSLQYDSDELVLDFSIEPGVMVVNSIEVSGDQLWEQRPSPLAQQLAHFFSVIAKGESTQEDLQCCLDSVAFTEFASAFNKHSISLDVA